MKRISLLIGFSLLALTAFGQNRTSFGGILRAADYAYGINGNIQGLRVDIGNTATGAQTITLAFGSLTLPDGTTLSPLAVTAPITVGSGSNAETVTPSAVSCNTPKAYDTCTVTATFSNTHGTGDQVTSGTFGIEEAVNAAHTNGGLVAIDGRWTQLGGVTGTVTGNKGFTNVTVLDWRGTPGALSYSSGSNGVNMTSTTHVIY